NHLRPIRRGAAGKGFHAAGGTEQMLYPVGVETVFGQRLLALLQLEIGDRREGQYAAAPAAIGTVAGERTGQIDLDPVAHRAAVTAACMHGRFSYARTTLAADSGSSSPKAR